jgi:hypothetical protein
MTTTEPVTLAPAATAPIDITLRIQRKRGTYQLTPAMAALARIVAAPVADGVGPEPEPRHVVETTLCRNNLPLRLRIGANGASNKCYAEVPIPSGGDLRFLRCPACGESL